MSAPSRLSVAAVLLSAVVLCDGLLLAFQDDRPAAAAGRVEVELRAPSRQPSLPAAAERPTEAGATAFVRYWFDALNWSLSTGDTDLLAHSTGAGCQQCTGYLVNIARWKANGSHLEGGLTAPLALAIGPFSLQEPTPYAASFLTAPASLTDAAGTTTSYAGGRTSGGLTVLWNGGAWQMAQLVIDGSRQAPS